MVVVVVITNTVTRQIMHDTPYIIVNIIGVVAKGPIEHRVPEDQAETQQPIQYFTKGLFEPIGGNLNFTCVALPLLVHQSILVLIRCGTFFIPHLSSRKPFQLDLQSRPP